MSSFFRITCGLLLTLMPLTASATGSEESPSLGPVEVICFVKWSQEESALSKTATAQPPFTVRAQFEGYTGGPAQNFNWVVGYKACSTDIASKAKLMCSSYARAPNKIIYQITLALSNANGNQMKYSQTYSCEQKEAQLESENSSND